LRDSTGVGGEGWGGDTKQQKMQIEKKAGMKISRKGELLKQKRGGGRKTSTRKLTGVLGKQDSKEGEGRERYSAGGTLKREKQGQSEFPQ